MLEGTNKNMNNGWVKLHRKLLENPLLRRDPNAYIVFTKLLLVVDWKTGSYDAGRFQLADLTGLKPSTLYKTLGRLARFKMVTQVSNNRFTTISICKWKEYQGDGNTFGNNQVTTREQQGNTKQEVKKERSKKVLNKLSTITKKDPQITSVISHFEKCIGKMPSSDSQTYAAINLISDHGYEKTIGAINLVAASRDEPFAPSVSSIEELQDKWIKLETFYRRKQKQHNLGVIT